MANLITTITITACCSKNTAHFGREPEGKCSRKKFHGVMLFGNLCDVDLCFWIEERFCETNNLMFQYLWWYAALGMLHLEHCVIWSRPPPSKPIVILWSWSFGSLVLIIWFFLSQCGHREDTKGFDVKCIRGSLWVGHGLLFDLDIHSQDQLSFWGLESQSFEYFDLDMFGFARRHPPWIWGHTR